MGTQPGKTHLTPGAGHYLPPRVLPCQPGAGIPLSTPGTKRPKAHSVKPWTSDPHPKSNCKLEPSGRDSVKMCHRYAMNEFPVAHHFTGWENSALGGPLRFGRKTQVGLYTKHMGRHKSSFQPGGKWLHKN